MNINIQKITDLSKKAGEAILEIYDKYFCVEYKEDKSPLTQADKASHKIIVDGLKNYMPDIPIFSEEGKDIPYERRKTWKYFWLVDPLDGTKEFIKKNGEFTVNIALINNREPVLGVVYAPVPNILYYAEKNGGAYRQKGNNEPEKLPVKTSKDKSIIKVVASKSHMSPETLEFVEELKKDYKKVELVNIGSSLKLCLVAEGTADIYPRLGPTNEWDTAASHIIVNESGKEVLEYYSQTPLLYNKENIENPYFIVRGASL